MIFEADIEYPEKVALKHEDLASLPERRNINDVEKLITTFEDKKRCCSFSSFLKQALNYGLKLKKFHRVIEFEQEDWSKPYIMMNSKQSKC